MTTDTKCKWAQGCASLEATYSLELTNDLGVVVDTPLCRDHYMVYQS